MEEPPRSHLAPFSFLSGFGFGVFVGVALALLAVALALERDEPSVVVPRLDPTVSAIAVTGTPEQRPRTLAALDVRLGPGTGFAIIGVLGRGETVEVVGRDAEAQWVAIRYPPGSTGRGWLPVTSVEGLRDVDRLAVVLPTPLPRTLATISPGGPANGVDDGLGGIATPRLPPTVTPTPGLPDLVITRITLLPDQRVAVTVANRGLGDVSGHSIFVIVRDLGVRSELITTPLLTLRVGATLTLETENFRVTAEQEIQAIVDPHGAIRELDEGNNTLQATLAPPPTPEAQPTIALNSP